MAMVDCARTQRGGQSDDLSQERKKSPTSDLIDKNHGTIPVQSSNSLQRKGGTLKLADHRSSSIIVNANYQNAGDQNISIVNSNFDGNTFNQTNDTFDTGAILMASVTNLTIENVTTNNVRTVGILAHDINYGHFDNLSCKTTSGNCFEFGLASGPWGGPREDRDTVIGSLTAGCSP
jgi:hypothetical protein